MQDGFAAVASPGRLERVRTSPTILVDAAHNPHGAAALAAALAEEFSFTRLVGVLAVMADKDARGILRGAGRLVRRGGRHPQLLAPVDAGRRSWPSWPSDVFGEEKVHVADRMDDAIALAVDLAETDADDVAGTGVIITGSVVSAGDGRAADRIGAGMSAPRHPSRTDAPDAGVRAPRPAGDPEKGLRGVMSATLVLEAITVLLAIPVAVEHRRRGRAGRRSR